jgi:replicative DNA helicase
VIDSLKDAVSTMVDDSLAVAFHNARMRALRNGVEIMELHHQRKATADAPRGQRPSLDQVYGSTWITAGAGSVLFITGRAGDPAVTLHHLKTPTGEIGPLDVTHDHVRGTTTVDPSKDPAVLLRNAPNGLTARDLAAVLIGGGDPERADVEKARRHLARLVDSGLATKADGIAGGAGGGQQTRYYASARHLTAVG